MALSLPCCMLGLMPDDAPQRVIDRILARISVTDEGCWLWPGATSKGHGHISWSPGGRQIVYGRVHRVMYTAMRGSIPEGLDLDHLCHDPKVCAPVPATDCPHRRCCNPDHLSPATRQANLLRGGTVTAERAAVTHCPSGHEYTAENTLADKKGRRGCRKCVYERNRAYYWKNRERRKAYNRAWRQRNVSSS